jgi:hypothetical protein
MDLLLLDPPLPRRPTLDPRPAHLRGGEEPQVVGDQIVLRGFPPTERVHVEGQVNGRLQQRSNQFPEKIRHLADVLLRSGRDPGFSAGAVTS